MSPVALFRRFGIELVGNQIRFQKDVVFERGVEVEALTAQIAALTKRVEALEEAEAPAPQKTKSKN